MAKVVELTEAVEVLDVDTFISEVLLVGVTKVGTISVAHRKS